MVKRRVISVLPDINLFLPCRVIYYNYIKPKKISISDIAECIGVPIEYLQKMLSGSIKMNMDIMRKVTDFLNIDIKVVYGLNKIWNFMLRLVNKYPQVLPYQHHIYQVMLSRDTKLFVEVLRVVLLKDMIKKKMEQKT